MGKEGSEMTEISPELLQGQAKTNPKGLAKVFCKSLQRSYPSLTEEVTLEAIESWGKGAKPKGIIEMFVHGWLDDGIDD